jgi:hypothetical protein
LMRLVEYIRRLLHGWRWSESSLRDCNLKSFRSLILAKLFGCVGIIRSTFIIVVVDGCLGTAA